MKGSIRVLEGGIVFPDGTTLYSINEIKSDGKPVVTEGSVVLEADNDKDGMGNVTVEIGDIKRLFIKSSGGEGRVGINVEDPRQALEVRGGILIGDTDHNVTGSIRFRNEQFQAFNGTGWRQLDASNLQAGGWVYDPLKQISFADPLTKFGIGITNPSEHFEVSGNIRAEEIKANYFKGNGKDITNIQSQAINGTVGLDHGGFGQVGSQNNRLLATNKSGNKVVGLPVIPKGKIILGVENGVPQYASFAENGGIDIQISTGQVSITHKDTSNMKPTYNDGSIMIQNINLGEYGHITSIVTKDITTIAYAKGEQDSRYLNASGDKMTGDLLIDSYMRFSGSGYQLSSKDNLPIQIESGVRLGVGITPKQLLDINGAMRIGNTTANIEGSLRYNTASDRFEGRNDQGWIGLDTNKYTAGGWSRATDELYVYNSQHRVGIGHSQPKHMLHINGNALFEGTLISSENISVNGTIYLGKNKISKGKLTGVWDLSNATIDGLGKLEANRVTLNRLHVNQDTVFKQDVRFNNKLEIGSTQLSDGNIIGDLNMNGAQVTNGSSIGIGHINIAGDTLKSNSGTLNIQANLTIGDSIQIIPGEIGGTDFQDYTIKSNQSVEIEGV